MTLSIGRRTATTDASGRFLLTRVRPGEQELEIDGASASTPESTYGRFEAPASIRAGRTTVLHYTVWMPKLDTDHAVRIDSPTTRRVVVASPLIPGLRLVIPQGSEIRDVEGDVVEEITITPIPIDRTPYPLFTNPTMYFTIQPEGAEILPTGARLIYPNYQGLSPGRRVPFMIHEADEGGWEPYGHGTVSRDGRRIVPSRYARLKKLTGSGNPVNAWIPAIFDILEALFGDPVDAATGLFDYEKTDFVLPGPMPIRRSCSSGDASSPRGASIPRM